MCIIRELMIFVNVLNNNKKKYKLYLGDPFAILCYQHFVHTVTLSCKCFLLFLFFTSLHSYFLNYVFVSQLAQESCQAGCLHSAPFTYLPTSLYSLLYNAKSTRVMCQIISSALFSFPLPIPFFQMANRSRRRPTVQLKDKLTALLSLVKVAPVQQRKKLRERAREREAVSHKIQQYV